ncbi:hypothetical protein [Aeromonas hydrophila]|uniref:hypothetical protein n=1 Tax=Aeromonas hydrophila TaxID=644 RepID=UPI000969CE55|nr:hypothetical protein [Aeromonas hydrophila]MBD5791204.1 hypothetical protein [Aeromonas hydrophila]OLQ76571.1 hypothetical protein BIU84_11990 [Aeromonas hydrophila]
MAVYPVKWYASEMQGAPNLGDTTAGTLAALLKAVLVTGFGTLTINALAFDAAKGWAVATFTGGHAYLQDSVVLVEGASPAAYNGEHRVMLVTATQVWFEIDGGNPGAAGSGAAMTMKVAPLGWTMTFESGDSKTFIVRPTNVNESGNVSLRIDNTAFSGWIGASYGACLAKVAMVEDVVDINTYTTIYEHRWPCTGRYSNKRWDLVGDNQLFYFMPAYAAGNWQFMYSFGYIRSIRPGDRYHAVLNHYPTTAADDAGRNWAGGSGGNTSWGNQYPYFDNSNCRAIARPYHQLFGAINWWFKGLFGRFGNGLNIPNGPDNGIYVAPDPTIVMEAGNHLRGYLPGLVCPFATVAAWDRKNFKDLPAIPGKLLRFVRVGFEENNYTWGQVTMMGFDLTGPWR